MGASRESKTLTRPVRVLQGVLFALAAGHGVALSAGLALGWDEAIPLSTAAAAAALGGVALMRIGRATAGFGLGAYGSVLMVLYAAFQTRGLQNIGMVALPTVVVLSGLLLNRRFLTVLTTFSIAGVWAMLSARHWVAGARIPPDVIGDALIVSVIIGLAAMAGWVFSSEMERKAQALRESEQRHRKVADCVPDTIWTVDMTGRFTYVTPASERSHGWKPEELLGRHYGLVLTEEEAARRQVLVREEVERARRPGFDHSRALTFETVEKRKDGSTFEVEVTLSLLWTDEGEVAGYIGATRDITERKRAEAERARLREDLAQAQKMESIGRLAGGIAHDFNNHLTVINGYTRLAIGRMEAGPGRTQLEEVARAGERAAALTRQLLAFSRRQMLVPRRLDLNRVVAEMAPMLERLMTGTISLRVALGRWPSMVLADQHQLEQVVMNLVLNARDAMPQGGTLTIETERLEEKCSVRLRVADSGTGMDSETRARIFEPFFTTKETGRGTGLGLAMVEGIVAQSGGRIEVESEVGRGTRFDVYLPCVEGEEESRTMATVAEKGKGAVLVVEDQAEVRAYVAEALKEIGYGVTQAGGAREALRLAQDGGVVMDLVITDLVMPEMGGGELARRLTEARPGVRVLFMSGYAEREKMGIEEGRAFLAKPFTPEQLGAKVRSVMEAGE